MSTVESQPPYRLTKYFVLMGVAGCGKTTIGTHVAEKLNASYIDGDDLHPKSNVQKMSRGEALNDEDRFPWLAKVGEELAKTSSLTLIGCSALKKIYRDEITKVAKKPVCFIHLKGDKNLILSRMKARENHFMPTSLLDSQFKDLEEPSKEENHFVADIALPFDDLVEFICKTIRKYHG